MIYFIELSRPFEMVLDLVERKEVMISDHGYDELADDAILVKPCMSDYRACCSTKDDGGALRGTVRDDI